MRVLPGWGKGVGGFRGKMAWALAWLTSGLSTLVWIPCPDNLQALGMVEGRDPLEGSVGQRMVQMELPDRQSPLVQAVAPGMQLSRGLGAQDLVPPGSWGS